MASFLFKKTTLTFGDFYMKFIIGRKLNMAQVWRGEAQVAVTRVQAGPCAVVQIKTNNKDKYEAVQIGFGEKKEKNIKKPQAGHLKNLGNFRYLKEFRTEPGDLKRGDIIDINTFTAGDKIKVTGISKGKGFQGVVKRHGFKGSKKTHGNKDQLRMPGSIGATGPAHVFKGQRMPGRMGNERVTTTNLEIIDVDKENNILLIKGSVPGPRNGLLLIAGEGNLIIKSEKLKAESGENDNKDKEAGKAEQKENEKIKNSQETPEQVEKEVIKAKEKVDEKKSSVPAAKN